MRIWLLWLPAALLARDRDNQLLLTWIQRKQQAVSLSRGLIVLNDKYILESPIQLPPTTSSDSLLPWEEPQISILLPVTSFYDRYSLDSRFSGGACGEVWLGRDTTSGAPFVLKRVFSNKLASGYREVFFGELLRGEKCLTRFIESFIRTSTLTKQKELWLVFEHEGMSLRDLLYDVDEMGRISRSAFWKTLRETGEAGERVRKEITRQLVIGLDVLSRHGVVHRDVKPANILIHDVETIKLGDFGSAVRTSGTSSEVLTRREHSLSYEPPEFVSFSKDEALLSTSFQVSFDAWSLGVVLLEMLLGTDHVFELSAAQQRGLKKRGEPTSFRNELAAFGLARMEDFNASVARLDEVYGIGFSDPHELQFVFALLREDPSERLSMEAALRHPFLNPRAVAAPISDTSFFTCSTCRRRFDTFSGCAAHASARHHGEEKNQLSCTASGSTPLREEWCASNTVLQGSSALDMWCGNRGRKTYSEDFFFASSSLKVFAVADGHLGDGAARFVTRRVVEEALKSSKNLSQVFVNVNGEFLSRFPQDSSGAAVSLAVVSNDSHQLILANVGDVRAILCCESGGSPRVLSVDHLASSPMEAARIHKAGGVVRFVNGRQRLNGTLALTRAFGDRELQPLVISEPHIVRVNLTTHSRFLVLASDGLGDAMSDADVVKVCRLEMERSESIATTATTTSSSQWEEETKPWYSNAAVRLVFEARRRDLTPDNVGVAVIPLRL